MSHLTQEQLTVKSALRHRPIGTDRSPLVQPIATRASRTQPNTPRKAVKKPLPRAHTVATSCHHWLFHLGLGLLATVVLIALGQAVLTWSERTWDDLHYGYPRTFQTDAFVGHESGSVSSHFIALNLHGRLEVVELPGDDAAHPRLYLGPLITGGNADLVPVTVQFVNDPHDPHRPDMLPQFQGSHLLFHNKNGQFAPFSS